MNLAGLYVVLTTSLSLYILSEPPERSLHCQILLSLRCSYTTAIMGCGTIAVTFRSVSWEVLIPKCVMFVRPDSKIVQSFDDKIRGERTGQQWAQP